MPRFRLPTTATIHTARAFLEGECPFDDDGGDAVLELHPAWAYLEPIAVAMVAAWGAHWQRLGRSFRVENHGPSVAGIVRSGLFERLGLPAEKDPHSPAHRGVLPVVQVKSHRDVSSVLDRFPDLLDLSGDPETLAAVKYCTSELIRNVLEHSGSPDGAFVAARRYVGVCERVTIAVTDCGRGIGEHLARAHPEAGENALVALGLAMTPGVTGALPGMYGTPDNAGAGLFITRSIAKGTGGYFLLVSGDGAYRMRRTPTAEQLSLLLDPFDEPRFDRWRLACEWPGTAASLEIRTDRIGDYDGFFEWIFRSIPTREERGRRIRFT